MDVRSAREENVGHVMEFVASLTWLGARRQIVRMICSQIVRRLTLISGIPYEADIFLAMQQLSAEVCDTGRIAYPFNAR